MLVVAATLILQTFNFNMIRLATYADAHRIIDLVHDFLCETAYDQAQDNFDREHTAKLIWTVQQYGWIWISEDLITEQLTGMLMAVREPNMWIPKKSQMREIVWYVRPEYRSTSLAGKLFLKYQEKAEDQLKSGRISGYFTTKMPTTQGLNLERRGFKLTELTYLKE